MATGEGGIDRRLGAAAALAALTGALHIYFAFAYFSAEYGLSVAFVLIGVAYFAGTAAALLGFQRDLVVKAGAAWTALMIVAWTGGAAAGRPPNLQLLSFLDKAIEVALLVLLILMVRSARRTIPKAG